jgi:hypothetical protein
MIQIAADATVTVPDVGQAFLVQKQEGCQVVICCSQGEWFADPQLWPGRTIDDDLRSEVEELLMAAKQRGEI